MCMKVWRICIGGSAQRQRGELSSRNQPAHHESPRASAQRAGLQGNLTIQSSHILDIFTILSSLHTYTHTFAHFFLCELHIHT